ncbi:MAG: four-helix bundle copper-binding protein [Isosphaeraceae bacterium]
MNRREIFLAAGAGFAGVALGATESRAQHPHHHDKLHGECLKACEACSTVCNETFHHCFEKVKDGHGDHHRIANLTIDCQEFCGLACELMARESPMISIVCLACADACKVCAAECSKHSDPQMKECLEACKKCEALCREMAKVSVDPESDAAKAK